MKPVFKLFLPVLLVLVWAPMSAMERAITPLKREDFTLQFSPENSSVKGLVCAINETPQGGLIAMNGSFINHPEIVNALKSAQERGARLELCVDARKSENKILLEKLEAQGLHASCGLHTKRCIFYDIDPKDSLEKALKARSAKVFTGSENLSNNAGTHHEYTFITKNPELVKCHYEDHLFNKSVCGEYKEQESDAKEFHRKHIDENSKKNLLLSPRFTRIYNSQKYNSSALKEARIAKPVPADVKESLYLSSMGFDDERIANALLKKRQQGSEITLVVDKSAVYSAKGLRLLNELHKVGVKIYVWEKSSSIQHTKLLLRQRRNKIDDHYCDSLAVLSTGNLVKLSSTEINYDQVVPESHVLSQEIRVYFDTLVPLCTPFEKIDQQAIASKKASKGKELFFANCGTCQMAIGAPVEKTLVRKMITHCIQEHDGAFENTAALANTDLKELYCAACPQCEHPFYNQKSVAAITLAIANHLVKEHAMPKADAMQTRKDIDVTKTAFYIAKKEENKK